ncbi:MAG: site-specific integrase [Planctomycetaceae bacterium]|nr:site-specific integrase [Planctomycetaceae bacterium]
MARSAKPWFCKQTGWWKVYVSGKKVPLAKGRSNLKVAKEALLDIQRLALRNPSPDSADQTVLSVIERYMEVRFVNFSENAKKLRTGYLQSFAERHGWRRVEDCRPDHLEEWLNKHPEWASDWTKRDAVAAIKAVFNWAKPKLVKENPFESFKQGRGLHRRDMTPEEFRAILRTTGSRYKAKPTPGGRFRQVLFFLWRTGCRPKEAADLKWSDVNLEQGTIVLKKHKTVRSQKQPEPRIIRLDSVVIRLLESIMRRNEGVRVFLTHRMTPWNRYNLGLRIRRARTAAGLSDDVKLYGTRHAFGTRGIVAGCDIKTLSVLMGHTDTKMTEHYAHIADKRDFLSAAVQQINQSLAASTPRPGARR